MLKVHEYPTVEKATKAISDIDEELGYPRKNATTYTSFFEYEDQFYIIADECTLLILGEPISKEFKTNY